MGIYCCECKKETDDSTSLYDEKDFDIKFCGTKRHDGGHKDVFKDIVVRKRYRLYCCHKCGNIKGRRFIRQISP